MSSRCLHWSRMSSIIERLPKLLVVDDEASVRESVAEVLRDERYVVATAGDGDEALHLLKSGLRPAAVILDLWMPGRDGFAVIDEMNAHPDLKHIPLIILTADWLARKDVVDRVAAFLPKPMQLDALLDAVAACSEARFAVG